MLPVMWCGLVLVVCVCVVWHGAIAAFEIRADQTLALNLSVWIYVRWHSFSLRPVPMCLLNIRLHTHSQPPPPFLFLQGFSA